MRGHSQEQRNFINAILFSNEMNLGIDFAVNAIESIYAAYASAEKGMRIQLRKGE